MVGVGEVSSFEEHEANEPVPQITSRAVSSQSRIICVLSFVLIMFMVVFLHAKVIIFGKMCAGNEKKSYLWGKF